MSQQKKTLSRAAAAAALALSPLALAADNPPGSSGKAIHAGDRIHCYGLHFCQSFHECASPKHFCKTPNRCGSGGFQTTTAKECLERGGFIADLED